ncbi:MAG: hypothetical protein WDA65_02945 [Christensenellales bacterium]
MEGEPGRQDLDSPSDVKWLTFAELADELCPAYMSMGVPYNEYWHGDYSQLAYYEKAFEMKRERVNHDAWLQGAYVYDALCFVSPILHAFAKAGTKPIPYHKNPYGTNNSGQETSQKPAAKTEKEIQEIQALNASARFASFMTQWNKRFDDKGGESDGGHD